ncbi:MAG TPA: WhiB family transcriptional regulator [Acidimicrobiales bacterium]|nr:WhiB family transcriptional regulator [Acidimicrobiales bacterium]
MDLTWKLAGACRFADTDLFYPVSDADAAPAKAVCEQCPVQGPCLDYALDTREPEGVWGGHTFTERRSILRRRRERERARLAASA